MSQKEVPSLKRAFDILDLLARDAHGLKFSEIQAKVKVPKASLSRILYQLLERECLQKDTETGNYTLGPKLVFLGHAFLDKLDIRDKAKSILRRLAWQTRETVELAILNRGKILYIDKHESSESVRLIAEIGSQYATLHASAVGKVFLAHMSKDEFRTFLKNVGLVRITEKTITDIDELTRECENIRREGIAYEDEECRTGVSRIASPIYDHLNRVAAVVGIAGPTFRTTTPEREKLGQAVREAARAMSRRIGYSGPE